MENLTVEQLKKLKQWMEQEIGYVIKEFEKRSGATVQTISIKKWPTGSQVNSKEINTQIIIHGLQ